MDNDPTRELFAAIQNHSSHRDYLHPERDLAALERITAALAAGADWRAPLGPGGRDAAFTAATQGSRGPLARLIAHGVPLDHANGGDGMLIHRAASFSNIDAVRFLVEQGVSPDVRDGLGRTPLAHARAWRHGAATVPVLLQLLQERGCTPGPALRGDDLRPDEVARVMPTTAPAVLRQVVEAAFVERAGARSTEFLRVLAEQRDEAALAAGIALVRRASTAKPKAKVSAPRRPKPIDLVHHGDLELPGDAEALTLVVTGDLKVGGRLTNFEGRVVGVGGDLTADVVWTEGPLVVGGDARVRTVFGAGDNDYLARIDGALDTPLFVHLDRRAVQIGADRSAAHVTERVPPEAREALRWR